jgi:antitoxin HicB
MRGNPRDWRIEDVAAVCAAAGVTCTAPRKGSHYKVKHDGQADFLTIPPGARSSRFTSRTGQVHRRGRRWRKRVSIRDYEIHIRPLSGEEGGGYLATVPELPGCTSDGETRAEALVNVEDAIATWLHCARKQGWAIPEPKRAIA